MMNISSLLNMLEEGQTIKISPIGCSMCPFFYGGRDDVFLRRPEFPLKRGEIALFRRKSGKYIIHRIHHVKRTPEGRVYYMLGDNQTWLEGPIPENAIQAVTVRIMRKGKLIDCRTNHFYRFLSLVWLYMRPIRPIFIKLWILIKPTIHKHRKEAILAEINSREYQDSLR